MRGYFLCIGAAKAGTTWLYDQLRHVPQTYFSPEKELNYFFTRYGAFDRLSNAERFNRLRNFVNLASQNFRPPLPDVDFNRKYRHFQRNLDWYEHFARGPVTESWYRRLFNQAGPQQYACDFSPSTSKIRLEGIEAIRALSDNVKLVYILRNPMDRLWSHLKFHAQFMGCFDEVKQYDPAQMVKFIEQYGLQEDGEYGRYLQSYRQVFAAKDILVLDFDDIRTAPADVLNRVTDFLDVPRASLSDTAGEAVNASERMKMPQGLLDGFKPRMREDMKILEGMGYGFVSKWADSLR